VRASSVCSKTRIDGQITKMEEYDLKSEIKHR